MYAASRPGRRWRRFCPSWRPVAALRFRSVATWLPSCRVLPTFPSIVLLTLPLRRGLPGSSSTPLFLLHSQLVDISPFRQRRSPHTCSSFTPPLHHQIHPWNRWFPLTLTLYRVLAQTEPGAFGAQFALALNNLAHILNNFGFKHPDPVEVAAEALEAYTKLMQPKPDGIAMALDTLGECLEARGRDHDAFAAYSRGIDMLLPQFLELPVAFQDLMRDLLER